jgi:signal transduction histidine kinase
LGSGRSARVALAEALTASIDCCVEAVERRLSGTASAELGARRREVQTKALELLARWLTTGQRATAGEAEWLGEIGAMAANEQVPISVMARNYLVFRDYVLDHIDALAERLATPDNVVASVRRELGMSIDGSLVSVARTYDRQLQRAAISRVRLAEELEQKVADRTRELEGKNEELVKIDELKTRFVNNASHELRTPLTAIRAFSELLAEDPALNDTQREFALAINLESERLSRLAKDLLDLSRVQNGITPWNPRSLDLHLEMGRLAKVQRLVAESRGIKLTVDLPERFPEVWADPDGLRQVLVNLISNALKFTEQGSIVLSAQRVDDRVVISVTDTGLGIREDDLARVFDPFYQAGNMLTEKPAGAGLGLTICREILAQHGSELRLESVLGQGSRFSFELPITR